MKRTFLLCTSRNQSQKISGAIRTNGRFINDKPIEHGTDDSYRISQDRQEISFQLQSGPGLKGLNYHIDGSVPEPTMYVEFRLDDMLLNQRHIFIGPEGRNPDENPFRLKRAW